MFLTLWFILIWYKFFQKRVNIMEMFCFGYQPLNFISVPRLKLTFGDWQVEKFRGSNLLPGKTLKVIIPRPCPVRFFFPFAEKISDSFPLVNKMNCWIFNKCRCHLVVIFYFGHPVSCMFFFIDSLLFGNK